MNILKLLAITLPITACALPGSWNARMQDCPLGTGKLEITEEEALIARGTIKVGMSECAVYRIEGMPTAINRSGGAYGNRTQIVFGGYAYGYAADGVYKFGEKPSYIYLEEGAVTSWQD
jgi:hypothetical protein